jgi:hypothetical protein
MTEEQGPKASEETPTEATPITPATPATTPATTPAATPGSYTTDVVSVGATKPDVRSDAADDDDDSDDEPLDAKRTSPHSAAAFALSLLALFQAPQNVFTAQGIQSSQFVRFILPTFAIPVLASIVALWLAFRGEQEIFMSEGKLGGVGYYKAARAIALGVLVIAAAAIILVLFFTDQPQQGLQLG